ncbi:MAG: hypothetical protein A2X25_13470 [Chloroflexi bacterium GWB2_49_20]|nr:MAG: hypothetical protein A2X25_13470 [Chloroflexi bacterium GWB2_49_20]OGN80005.1 MAG: hypothetical protein A2X26_03280 [Chloroflexi bacterium GWC2_49_37]OGN85459.1 MAG: hypothetical protein A2X27_03780 [Chloroflexi bacterium GWD2_49_16]HBG74324.1 hypothetical protein [Anaerolineae bacterium]HCM97066.1 hypothetical protein [Anaerolineae bacterium]
MRTPAGIECKYFYGDYYRGRNNEECRLLKEASQKWQPNFCKTCPIPSITRANSCEYMHLNARITKPALAFFKPRVQISAFCEKTHRNIVEPHIGCGECHPRLAEFEEQ